jgi:hypothetical protein
MRYANEMQDEMENIVNNFQELGKVLESFLLSGCCRHFNGRGNKIKSFTQYQVNKRDENSLQGFFYLLCDNKCRSESRVYVISVASLHISLMCALITWDAPTFNIRSSSYVSNGRVSSGCRTVLGFFCANINYTSEKLVRLKSENISKSASHKKWRYTFLLEMADVMPTVSNPYRRALYL